MTWNLYENEKFLEPLTFSNGKTQEDVVKEIIDLINKGNKVIFVDGKCGSGKSAIALNVAREIGKASIIVPIKNLQMQYKKDYENGKYLLKDDGNKLKINVITGRKNHKCKFLEDNKNTIPKLKREINSKLHDIFEGRRERVNETISNDISADNKNIPCKIELKEKNWSKIKDYLKQNKRIDLRNFTQISDVKRLPVASVCPYWSPVFPEEFDIKVLDEEKRRNYTGLNGKRFNFYRRKCGCPFYEQFNSYIDSDVIVFNSSKYKLESAMDRKPLTDVEIIDECDEFLDSFSNQRSINVDRLQNSLNQVFSTNKESFNQISEIIEILKQIRKDQRIESLILKNEIIELKKTGIYDLFKILTEEENFLDEIDEESYVFDVKKTARMFKEFLDESYITFSKKDENLIANIVTTNLSKKFAEMIDKNKTIVLMSGTLHDKDILKEIFGIDDFKIIEAESNPPGKIILKKTGLEKDCKYSNFYSGKITRKQYLESLDNCLKNSSRPTLVHVNSFQDLPNEKEIFEYNLTNLISSNNLIKWQEEDNEGRLIQDFKSGKIKILFSTRTSRGIDFPGDECNSIIFTKYPNPNVQDAFWKILNKTKPQDYWKLYRDKARRELLQKVYRGLRFKEDKVEVWSPDSRVLDALNW